MKSRRQRLKDRLREAHLGAKIWWRNLWRKRPNLRLVKKAVQGKPDKDSKGKKSNKKSNRKPSDQQKEGKKSKFDKELDEYLERIEADAKKRKEQQEAEEGDEPSHGTKGDTGDGSEPVELEDLDTRVFRQRLRSIMTDNKYDRVVRNRRQGKLDLKNLPKTQTGSESVFYKKSERKNKEYNVILLVDVSGSMFDAYQTTMDGKRAIDVAVDSTVHTAEAFEGLNINLQVKAFDSSHKTIVEFGEKMPPKQELSDKLRAFGGGGTKALPALDASFKEFQGLDGKNIVVLLTDGDSDGDDSEVAVHLKANPHVAVVGVGIMMDVRYIPGSIRIDDLSGIEGAITEQLNKHIKRG